MVTRDVFNEYVTGGITAVATFRKAPRLPTGFGTYSLYNIYTYYRMQGYDTVSSSWKTWVVQDTPDPSAGRHPTPNSVSISNAFIIDRWQA